jgi:DNA repair protein RecN (Recombination protein N)
VLSELRVENLGIIAELCVTFGEGLTAITGETGAGKTLLVDALELLCGGRADPQTVRDGADEARVEARFVVGDIETVLARVVPANGRSRGYVDGRLATATELAEVGRQLVDLHGQHAHQSLLAPAEQRALLDAFVGTPAGRVLQQLRDARNRVRAVDVQLKEAGGDERARAREIDLLRYQLDEIDAAGVADVDEDARLSGEEQLLADAEAHRAALLAAHTALEGAAIDALGTAVGALTGREPFTALADRLRILQGEIAEAAHDVRDTAESVIADPERLTALQARRAQLRELMRKYGPTLAEVAAYGAESRDRLTELEEHDIRAAVLDQGRADALKDAARAATALSKARHAAAGTLAGQVSSHLRELAMPAATFSVAIEPAELGDDGADDITFLLAPNPGEPPRPLARAASGGELARTMLALRLVLSEAPPTLIFDEVDAGIGGEAGGAVGRALADLGVQHQVLCVTHLAQVAACAGAQLVVSKRELDGRTVADAELLLDEARVSEISRMLAGVGESAHAKRHAQELLRHSRELTRKQA